MRIDQSNLSRYQLHPFLAYSKKAIQASCSVIRSRDQLRVVFFLSGEVIELVVPDMENAISRKDSLWQTTCFECFFKAVDRAKYWELNVSPGGCWNLYRFTDYRQGMQEEKSVHEIASYFTQEKREISLSCSLPLGTILEPDAKLAVGLSCVLEHKSGEKQYWALCHPGDVPDFHHPESMALIIP